MTTTTQPLNALFDMKFIILWFFAVILALATLQSCAGGRGGCPSTRGLSGYSQAGFGKPLCIDSGCTYFSDWSYLDGSIVSCLKHSIEDYQDKDSVIWIEYKREMTFGY